MKYEQFLATKRHTSGDYGFDAKWMPECAFDFQRLITKAKMTSMGLLFTAISVVRSYIIRRWFNAMLQRAAQRMAKAVA